MQNKTAVYSGSFDPVTNGHLDVIRRAARLFGAVRAVVLVSPNKKPLFSAQERVELLRRATADIPGVTVDAYAGLLADYLHAHHLCTVVRGIRGAADLEGELAYAHANRLLDPQIETVFLPADPALRFVSSSAAREVFSYGRELPGYVPEASAAALRAKFPAAGSKKLTQKA